MLSAPPRRVVVTGIGLITPIGDDADTVWASLLEGTSGVGPITRFDATDYPTRIAAEVRDFDPADHMDRKTARNAPRYAQFALAAARQATAHGGLDHDRLDPQRFGAIVSSGVGGVDEFERNVRIMLDRGIKRISPFAIPMLLVDTAASLVAIHIGARGPNYGISSACASSGHAIGEAAELIRRDDTDVMLAGGAEACITPFAMGCFSQMRATSERNDEPERACRPWDVERDGLVMGEGAAILVLEEREHARARGAAALAEVVGYGASADGHHLTAPEPSGDGAVRAMRQALGRAALAPAEVQYVNAHGTSTRLGDIAETRAIKQVFGNHAPVLLVSSTKSMHGHLMGAAGALEAAICVLAIRHGVAPPTINLERPDDECDLDYVPNVPRPVGMDVVLSNSFGFGGHNVSLVIRRPAPDG